eukprot:scaffold14842_cov61-Phaeocystis_antarctica.AAC.3
MASDAMLYVSVYAVEAPLANTPTTGSSAARTRVSEPSLLDRHVYCAVLGSIPLAATYRSGLPNLAET